MEERTHYGMKKRGKSRFVIVAPHAAGDDLKTKEIADSIARYLDAFFVINTKYKKITNSQIKNQPVILKRIGEDFNKLVWPKRIDEWADKQRHKKEFYDDIKEFVTCVHKYNKNSVIIYIHGMRDGNDKIGIDIGCGLKYCNGKLLSATRHPNSGNNTGVRRMRRIDAEKLKQILTRKISKYNLRTGIGEAKRGMQEFAAWDRRNGIQFHAGSNDISFQLELAYLLRRRENLGNTSKIIAEALKLVYS